jgi:hypothetical protein
MQFAFARAAHPVNHALCETWNVIDRQARTGIFMQRRSAHDRRRDAREEASTAGRYQGSTPEKGRERLSRSLARESRKALCHH